MLSDVFMLFIIKFIYMIHEYFTISTSQLIRFIYLYNSILYNFNVIVVILCNAM